jgi:two-component system nitrate/nitrite response regulator NarL
VTSVFIVAEVRIYREGLALALARQAGIEVVGAGKGLDDLAAATPGLDVIILDMLIPSKLFILNALRAQRPATKVVALGVSDDADETVACAELGICGLVSREASLEELVVAVNRAMRGELQCSPRAAGVIVHRLAALSRAQSTAASEPPLTKREAEVVGLIDHGLSNKEIARQLGIEMATVKNHVHNVLKKLNARRRGEAAARVRRVGFAPSGQHREPQLG